MRWRSVWMITGALVLWAVALGAIVHGAGDIVVSKETTKYVRDLTLDVKVLSWTVVPQEGSVVKATGDTSATAELLAGEYTVTAWISPSTGRIIRLKVGEAPVPPAPVTLIESFTIAPEAIQKGATAKITWSATKAKTVTLNGAAVALSGSQDVSPSVTTTFTLVATDGAQTGTLSRILTVADAPVPPVPPVPTDLGAAAAKVATDVAAKLPEAAKADTKVLGSVYLKLAEKIPAGITDPGMLERMTRGARVAAFPPDRDAALNPWAQEVGAWINAQVASGAIKTMDQYKVVWVGIGKGLSGEVK